jgi:outer membrane biosynthesis protein TonB
MMTERRCLRPFAITSLVVIAGLLAAPVGTSMAWATSHDTPRIINKKPMMKAPAAPAAATSTPQGVTTQALPTLDSYINYVSDKLQAEAMKVKQQGSADVKLTIDKNGSVRLAEVVRVDGPAALRDEVMGMVNLIGSLPPLPPDANADVLVLTSTVVFNYPGRDMYDHLGERTSSRR